MNKEPLWQGRAHGKLLLTGEYAVLDGALALALPVRYGQSLRVEEGPKTGQLQWISQNYREETWFQAVFNGSDFDIVHTTNHKTAEILQHLLQACRQQNPSFFIETEGYRVTTKTDFPREWGLGTSSTLIALLARWTSVDPYKVLFDTLGGSGYDIACAFAEGPLLYRLEGRQPHVEPVHFHPPFAGHLFFIFLGKKQNSRDAIQHYRQFAQQKNRLIEAVSRLTRQCLESRDIDTFTQLLLEHERLISEATGLPRAQELYFGDFPGVVKSLGAWGGDFVLAAGSGAPENIQSYFQNKGCEVIIPYREMVL